MGASGRRVRWHAGDQCDCLKLYIDGAPVSLTFLSSVPATTPTSATRRDAGRRVHGCPRQQCQPPAGAACGANRRGASLECRTQPIRNPDRHVQSYARRRSGSLAGYWPLDEGSGNTTADKASSQTGVLIGVRLDRLIAAVTTRLGLTFATLANIPVSNTLVGIDPDGGAVTYTVFTAPAHGAVQISGAQSGAFTYTPATNFVGADAFIYQVADTGGSTDTATVTVTMSPPSTGAIEGVVLTTSTATASRMWAKPALLASRSAAAVALTRRQPATVRTALAMCRWGATPCRLACPPAMWPPARPAAR